MYSKEISKTDTKKFVISVLPTILFVVKVSSFDIARNNIIILIVQKSMAKCFESWMVKTFWKNMYRELLSHIKINLCWFNLTYFRKWFDEKNEKKYFQYYMEKTWYNQERYNNRKTWKSDIGLVDIEIKLKALKVKRLTDDSNVTNNIVNSYLNVMKIDL